MGFWSGIFKAKGGQSTNQPITAAGVLRDEQGWYYEELQDYSRSQSTIRIEQRRPGNWKTLEPSCGIVGLNSPDRHEDVVRFFAGSYRWLRIEHVGKVPKAKGISIKVVGTYRDKAGKEQAVDLGFLGDELAEQLKGLDLRRLWGRIRFIRFPVAGRDNKYLIRFDLMVSGDR